MNTKITYTIVGLVILLLVLAGGVWFFFFRSTATISTNGDTTGGLFGGNPNTTNTTPVHTDTNGNLPVNTTTSAAQKIFKISDGPIVGATLMQTLRPTTTVARYIRQDDGHVFDIPLGVAGAVPRVVSNVTIPGGQRALWLEGGNAALMQYLDDSSVIKTVYLGFPIATSTAAELPTKIQFLPDNLLDVAASPDGKSIAYLVKTTSGSDGYIAKSDGTGSKKTFSLPLSQLLLSWPSANTILVQTKSAAGVNGVAFSVDAKNGAAVQLVAASGLSATADPSFSEVVYEKSDGANQLTFSHNVKSGLNSLLSFSPIPEKCIWSKVTGSLMYCATPLQYVPANYLDLWHQGTGGAADALFSYNLATSSNTILATPGSTDGGKASDILEMSLSPNERYLSYTTKGGRMLWGVNLGK